MADASRHRRRRRRRRRRVGCGGAMGDGISPLERAGGERRRSAPAWGERRGAPPTRADGVTTGPPGRRRTAPHGVWLAARRHRRGGRGHGSAPGGGVCQRQWTLHQRAPQAPAGPLSLGATRAGVSWGLPGLGCGSGGRVSWPLRRGCVEVDAPTTSTRSCREMDGRVIRCGTVQYTVKTTFHSFLYRLSTLSASSRRGRATPAAGAAAPAVLAVRPWRFPVQSPAAPRAACRRGAATEPATRPPPGRGWCPCAVRRLLLAAHAGPPCGARPPGGWGRRAAPPDPSRAGANTAVLGHSSCGGRSTGMRVPPTAFGSARRPVSCVGLGAWIYRKAGEGDLFSAPFLCLAPDHLVRRRVKPFRGA